MAFIGKPISWPDEIFEQGQSSRPAISSREWHSARTLPRSQVAGAVNALVE
jgi:hypothetical protein